MRECQVTGQVVEIGHSQFVACQDGRVMVDALRMGMGAFRLWARVHTSPSGSVHWPLMLASWGTPS